MPCKSCLRAHQHVPYHPPSGDFPCTSMHALDREPSPTRSHLMDTVDTSVYLHLKPVSIYVVGSPTRVREYTASLSQEDALALLRVKAVGSLSLIQRASTRDCPGLSKPPHPAHTSIGMYVALHTRAYVWQASRILLVLEIAHTSS